MLAGNQTIGPSLLGFNVGLEAGQILCVTLILCASYFVIHVLRLKRVWWIYILSTATIIWAVKYAIERIP